MERITLALLVGLMCSGWGYQAQAAIVDGDDLHEACQSETETGGKHIALAISPAFKMPYTFWMMRLMRETQNVCFPMRPLSSWKRSSRITLKSIQTTDTPA